ncbi:hypothetical protein P0D69_40100 [Paraburkholderia sediminicola]|uniref:hypothetical protein n=1 Tax=Paraburkholderia sediminicola TaxID=458836 RepID=UPI0038B9AFB1
MNRLLNISRERAMAEDKGDVDDHWHVSAACFNCGAVRTAAPDLLVERNGASAFAHQPAVNKKQKTRGEASSSVRWLPFGRQKV